MNVGSQNLMILNHRRLSELKDVPITVSRLASSLMFTGCHLPRTIVVSDCMHPLYVNSTLIMDSWAVQDITQSGVHNCAPDTTKIIL